MDSEFSSEKKTAREGELPWKDKMEKLVGKLRNNIFAKETHSTIEQIRWILQRPSIEEIQSLLGEGPKEEALGLEEKTLTQYTKEVVEQFRDLTAKIEEVLRSENVWRLRSIWTNAVEHGVSFNSYLSRPIRRVEEKGTKLEEQR